MNNQLNRRLLLCVHMLYSLHFEIKVPYWIYTVIWVMKRRLSIINLTLEINLLTFRLNAPVVIRVKLLEHSVEISFSELKFVTDTLSLRYSATNWETTEAFGRWKCNHGYEIVLHLFSNILPLATLGKLHVATLKMFRLFMLKIEFFSTGAARSLTCELLFLKWWHEVDGIV